MTYGPNRLIALGAGVGALAFLGLIVGIQDQTGRLLYVLAGLALLALCVNDLWWNPRLVVDARGLTLRTPGHSGLIGWPDIEEIRVDERARLGLSARTLEIDAAESLVILSRRALGGTDPRDVAAIIDAFRPPAAPG